MEDEQAALAAAVNQPQVEPQSNQQDDDPFEEEDLHSMMQKLLDRPEHTYRNLQHGDAVDGTIMRIERDELLIDIGSKSEGIVPSREMATLTSEEKAALNVGDKLLLFVVQSEDQEGRAILSIDKARQERSWRQLLQSFEAGEILRAKVINYNKGGLLVNLDGVRGFVPSSQITSVGRGADAQKQSELSRLVGQSLPLKIIEINRSRNRLILSERQAIQEEREHKKGELLGHLKEGDVRKGIVTSLADFGAFVDIGGADGLIHLSELSWSRVKHPSEVLKPGDEVEVYVLSIDDQRKRIALSLKRTQREPWATVNERYSLGQTIQATVTQLASFGAFARIEEGVEGLIHVSELGEGHVQHPKEVLQEGDVVTARIIRIDPARKRIGLSLRRKQEEDDQEDAPAEGEPADE